MQATLIGRCVAANSAACSADACCANAEPKPSSGIQITPWESGVNCGAWGCDCSRQKTSATVSPTLSGYYTSQVALIRFPPILPPPRGAAVLWSTVGTAARTASPAPFLVTYSPRPARLSDLVIDARPPPIFVGDTRALDFLNSIASPVDTPIEWLSSGVDLLDWLAAAKLIPPEVMTSMRRAALPGELDAVATQARALREWFRGFVHQYKGKPLKPDALKDLAPLNRILERDQEFGQIVKRDPARDSSARTGVARRQMRRWQTADTLLL